MKDYQEDTEFFLWKNFSLGLRSCREFDGVKHEQQMCKPAAGNGGQKIRRYL